MSLADIENDKMGQMIDEDQIPKRAREQKF